MSKSTELVSDIEIREGIYNHEVDGHAVTRIAALGNAMQDAGLIHVNERRDKAFMRELSERCMGMVEKGTLEAANGGWRLPEPAGTFRMVLQGGERDITYTLSECNGDDRESLEVTNGYRLATTIGNLLGFKPDYVRRVVLSSIVPGKKRAYGARSLRFIIERIAEESWPSERSVVPSGAAPRMARRKPGSSRTRSDGSSSSNSARPAKRR